MYLQNTYLLCIIQRLSVIPQRIYTGMLVYGQFNKIVMNSYDANTIQFTRLIICYQF